MGLYVLTIACVLAGTAVIMFAATAIVEGLAVIAVLLEVSEPALVM